MQRIFISRSDLSKPYRGLTLVETALTLSIIALLTAGVWLTAESVTANQRLGQAAERTTRIVDKMRAMYTGQQDAVLSEVTTTVACGGVYPCDVTATLAAKPIDNNIFESEGTRNPWGGNIRIFFMNPQGNFSIQFDGLTSKSCGELLSRIEGYGTRNATTVTTFIPSVIPRLGNLQGGGPVNAFYRSGTNWIDVTRLTLDQIADNVAFEDCTAISYYFVL